ncbi:MAG: sodium:proton antiporter [Candidatus Parabeggiatoa sp. nov. 3]|nr:MAG: sodium:proton antiporter [Gammaproteobacteria bacterium]RKZ65836.1 MAG: sodium:proton antiporter [Gammaproteobacteria bacterium]RKZ87300.1 MAG: sodium:proton antiporter [Gammaproteobacteria bacterium]HEW98562.1 sodium:proton antiporter [Beggiatoa sp.]
MDKLGILVVLLAVFAFALVSGRAQRSIITPPMVFVLFGFLLSLGLLPVEVNNTFIHILAEITLILVLFTDAARIDLRLLRKEHDLPVRLLLIGMPLTIVFGAILATLMFPNLLFWECALLAAILAPTDAALGQAVVSSPKVPVRIRQTLNVESGLNDGIALPAVLIFAFLAAPSSSHSGEGASYWVVFVSEQLILGPLAGIIVGLVGAKLLNLSIRFQWVNHSFRDLSVIALAFLAYFGAELIGGNGFIAAFTAGLTFGNVTTDQCDCLYEFAESEGQLLNLLVFLFFGALMLPIVITGTTWWIVLFCLLSLTVVRMIPVSLSLLGKHLRPETQAFVGWFGPRGLASILFVLLIVEEFSLPGTETIMMAVLTTVVLSIFLHGVTANLGTHWYEWALSKCQSKGLSITSEHQPVQEMPVRLPYSKE